MGPTRSDRSRSSRGQEETATGASVTLKAEMGSASSASGGDREPLPRRARDPELVDRPLVGVIGRLVRPVANPQPAAEAGEQERVEVVAEKERGWARADAGSKGILRVEAPVDEEPHHLAVEGHGDVGPALQRDLGRG